MSLKMISQKVKRNELKLLSNHKEELKICWANLRASLIIKYFILSQLLMTFLLKQLCLLDGEMNLKMRTMKATMCGLIIQKGTMVIENS